MCGICGVLETSFTPVKRELIEAMASAMQHRGPDGSGFYVSQGIGLGHRRLSIIDVAGGGQPITNEDGSLLIVFNGEIYNFIELRKDLLERGHVFRTKSDTEVIIHAYEEWGSACVDQFNGIFAFAVWDSVRKQLFLARDHLGVKPLYYTQVGTKLLFASEIKALLVEPDCQRSVDLHSLSMLFTLRYVPSPHTMFGGIKKLPPGHHLTAGSHGIQVRRYWNRLPAPRLSRSPQDLIEQYQALLEDSVRLQMRSDVPVGLFLSSGVDSGVLLAIMRKYSNQPVRTFTIGFEDGEQSNETCGARELASMFGAEHSEMIISPKDYLDYYQRYQWDLEEPVGNESAAAFYFVSFLAAKHVKVALTGQGADEPWAGYHRYVGVQLSQLYSRMPMSITDGVIRPAVEKFMQNERLRRAVASLSEPDILRRFVKIYSFYGSEMKERLFKPWVKAHVTSDGEEARQALEWLQSDVAHLDPLAQMLYIDTRANLPDDLLMVADKTAMANSLEARVPFLDYRVVEFIESLPSDLKLHRFRGKYLHKKAAEKWLPKKIVYRKKKGFANPIDLWLRGAMLKYVEELLLSKSAAVGQYFDQAYIRQLIEEHRVGHQQRLRHIYLLISFEMWHQRFMNPVSAR